MRGVHFDPLVGPGFEPARRNPAARKDEGVPFLIDHRQFQINVVWRSYDGLPFHGRMVGSPATSALDPHRKRLLLTRTNTGRLL